MELVLRKGLQAALAYYQADRPPVWHQPLRGDARLAGATQEATMMLHQLEAPCDAASLDFILHTFDIILACATTELGPVDVVKMLRDKADCIEAISRRRMH